jgi:phytoene synthase
MSEIASRSFALAARLFDSERREDAARVYAFCRMVDDLADEGVNPRLAGRRLERIRCALCSRTSCDPVTDAFLLAAERNGIELEHALLLVGGVESDLSRRVVEDDRDLLRYCYRVAGTVGLMMCPLIGVRSGQALPFAIDLGIAMQLTNICRDVAEDARRGRIYLPRVRLEGARIEPRALLEGKPLDRSSLAFVVSGLLELAERYYESGIDGFRFIPGRARAAIAVASSVYRAIGRKLERRGCDPLLGRTFLSAAQRSLVASVALLRLLAPRRGRPHDPALHRLLEGLPGVAHGT